LTASERSASGRSGRGGGPHPRVEIIDAGGRRRSAAAPVLLSASRATDIPAFHARWFFRRLEAGWFARANPFNGRVGFISTERVRAVVFWTKYPRPIFPYLDRLEERGIGFYFLYTLNDYEPEGLEPGLPLLRERIAAFRTLAERIGPERVLWRFDPLIRVPGGAREILERIDRLRAALGAATRRLIFSFVEVERYRKVRGNLRRAPLFRNRDPREAAWSELERNRIAGALAERMRRWRREDPDFAVRSCAVEPDLRALGIEPNRCIDDRLLRRLYPDDGRLQAFLGPEPTAPAALFPASVDERDGPATAHPLKDPGQRPACGCIVSRDVGGYDSCGYGCFYCYATRAADSGVPVRRRAVVRGRGA